MNMQHIEEQFNIKGIVHIDLPDVATMVLKRDPLIVNVTRVDVFRGLSMNPIYHNTISGNFILGLFAVIKDYQNQNG